MPRLATIAVLVLALAHAGTADAAAAKAPAKAEAKGSAKAPVKAEAAKAPDDADLASAGKVIEIDPSGNAKTVKGSASDPEVRPGAQELDGESLANQAADPAEKPQKLKAGELSQADACRLRFKAQCSFLKRCLSQGQVPLPISCEDLVAACDGAPAGKAPYSKKEAEACAKGVAAVGCSGTANLADPAALNPELKVAACKPLLDADAKSGGPGAFGGGGGGPGLDPADIDLGGALTGE